MTRLIPMTPAAKQAIAGADALVLKIYPFRIGRESRTRQRAVDVRKERRGSDLSDTNDAYLLDQGHPTYISREHLQIERTQDGRHWVSDRGSTHGTVVDDHWLGGNGVTARCIMRHNSVLTIGSPNSPYKFRFEADLGDHTINTTLTNLHRGAD